MSVFHLWTNGDHITVLAETLEVEGYFCGIVDVWGKLDSDSNTNAYFLCSDISEEIFVNNIKLPVVKQLKLNDKGFIKNVNTKTIWTRVICQSISKIRLYICNDSGEIQSFKGKGLHCTLVMTDRFQN